MLWKQTDVCSVSNLNLLCNAKLHFLQQELIAETVTVEETVRRIYSYIELTSMFNGYWETKKIGNHKRTMKARDRNVLQFVVSALQVVVQAQL